MHYRSDQWREVNSNHDHQHTLGSKLGFGSISLPQDLRSGWQNELHNYPPPPPNS